MPYPDSAEMWKRDTRNMLVEKKLQYEDSSITVLDRQNDWGVLVGT